MASQTQGIQQLLAAEKRAAEKVSEARKRKWKNFSFCLRFLFFMDFFNLKISLISRETKAIEASKGASPRGD